MGSSPAVDPLAFTGPVAGSVSEASPTGASPGEPLHPPRPAPRLRHPPGPPRLSRHTLTQVLDHADYRVTSSYDRFSYDDELREWMVGGGRRWRGWWGSSSVISRLTVSNPIVGSTPKPFSVNSTKAFLSVLRQLLGADLGPIGVRWACNLVKRCSGVGGVKRGGEEAAWGPPRSQHLKGALPPTRRRW
jgi:hypothetical protein